MDQTNKDFVNSVTCKERVWRTWNYSSCNRKATRDGYCGIHHPDHVEKRKEKQREKWAEKRRLEDLKYERIADDKLRGMVFADIDDPVKWRAAVDRLIEAARIYSIADATDNISREYELEIIDALKSIILIQPVKEEKP